MASINLHMQIGVEITTINNHLLTFIDYESLLLLFFIIDLSTNIRSNRT